MTILNIGRITINGEESFLASRPINYLLKKINSKLDYNPFDDSTDKEYNATWLIKNNILYLKTIEFTDSFKYKEEVSTVLFKHESLIADWYNGVLLAYSGDPVWFRKGIHPVYEKELIFKVENGVVVDHEVIVNELPF